MLHKVRLFYEELARVAGSCSSRVRASDPLEHPGSRKAAVLFPVAYTSFPEGGQGLKVQTNVKAGVVTNLSVAVTQNVTVNQSTTMTVSAGPDM